MRTAILLAAALAAVALAGCFTNQDRESTSPSPATTQPLGPADVGGTGCTGSRVGSGTGDVTAPRACNATNSTNASNASI